jgi:hypothetical protein
MVPFVLGRLLRVLRFLMVNRLRRDLRSRWNHLTFMKKIKISIDEQREVEQIRAAINEARNREDAAIQNLASKMNLSDEDSLILWDYVHNDSYWMVEIR